MNRLPILAVGGGGVQRGTDGPLWSVSRVDRIIGPAEDIQNPSGGSLDKKRERDQGLEDRFFDVAIDLLCHLDFGGHFMRLSPSWARTLGFTLEELTARPFIEFVHPDDRERTLEQNRRVRAGERAIGFENRYVCKDGSYRWLLWNAAPDMEQGVIYSVARDVTERKQAEEERARAEAERERLVRQLQQALAEVRTLQELLPICSYCRRIRGDEDYWHTVEAYIAAHTNSRFSHAICPDCHESEVEPQFEAVGGE